MSDITVEPSVGVVGRIQPNTDEGRCLLVNPSEILTKESFLLLLLSIVKYWDDGCSAPCCVKILRLGCRVLVLAGDSKRFGTVGSPHTIAQGF